MAEAVMIQAFPHFSAWRDGETLPGAKLYTYRANTTTPKEAYHDPYLATPHANPVVLDSSGERIIYLDGAYHLMLYDATDVLMWDVLSFEFTTESEPVPGTIQTGSTAAVVNAAAGQGQLTITSLVPIGYRVLGVTSKITTEFGNSGGLTGIMVGDNTVLDGWGFQGSLLAGAVLRQQHFRRGDCPININTYTIRLSAFNGTFDAAGQMEVRAHWQGLLMDPIEP